ncbi:hypothetical protein DRO54_09750 [Candidatus Bathyarchaeota archaeon]|nr:MAG: hypothetical protein DRO54_09750 [Candidatus Bathyarchaeota archaeon]
MREFIYDAGGRKFLLTVIVLILVALKDVLKLDSETIKLLVAIALGGAATVAVEDGLRALKGGKAASGRKS